MNSDCSVVSLREGRQQQQQGNVERQFRKLPRHLSIYHFIADQLENNYGCKPRHTCCRYAWGQDQNIEHTKTYVSPCLTNGFSNLFFSNDVII